MIEKLYISQKLWLLKFYKVNLSEFIIDEKTLLICIIACCPSPNHDGRSPLWLKKKSKPDFPMLQISWWKSIYISVFISSNMQRVGDRGPDAFGNFLLIIGIIYKKSTNLLQTSLWKWFSFYSGLKLTSKPSLCFCFPILKMWFS